MKVVLIVYVVSWLILLLIYISSKFKKKQSQDFIISQSSSEVPWYFYLIMAFISPFVVLFIPFIIYRDYKNKKEMEKRNADRLRRENAEKERVDRIVMKYKAALVSGNHFSDEFVGVAKDVIALAKNKSYELLLDRLSKLSLPLSCTLDVEPCSEEGHGDVSKLYISDNGIYDYAIWNYFTVEDSHMGAWQAYLLDSIWRHLPMFWHAGYGRRSYIYSGEDIPSIEHIRKEEPRAFALIKNFDLAPEIVKNGSTYYITCCYWNDWSGLNRELIEVFIENNKVKSISSIKSDNLIKYDCGIRF